MLSLVIVFAVFGVFLFLGARYAIANRRWFVKIVDRLARQQGTSWQESSRLQKARLFLEASWKVNRERSLFRPAADPDVEVVRRVAVERFRVYARAFTVFAVAVLVFMVVVLIVIGVHALT